MEVRSLLVMLVFIAYSCCLAIEYDHQDSYNVLDFGAKGNGQDEDSQAFLKAWNDACGTNKGTSTLQVPQGKTYLLGPLTFKGPCKSNKIRIQMDGNIVAPDTPDGWKSGCQEGKWLHFMHVNNLVISGKGTFDGRGSMWWTKGKNVIIHGQTCKAPTLLRFYHSDNLELEGFNSLNSPNKHIGIQSCHNVSVSHVHIRAPETSPNTDGIVISGSSQINVFESFIGTGDDCVAIKGGSSHINITQVECGPGHGISVGSLGIGGGNQSVEEVRVRNCSFKGTTNGARIKTRKGGSGYARAISFEHITIPGSKYPIIIDQKYAAPTQNRDVNISDVTYRNFTGFSLSKVAIMLDCGSLGCSNIVMDRIRLLPAPKKVVKVSSFCRNAHGKATYTSPPVPCLNMPK